MRDDRLRDWFEWVATLTDTQKYAARSSMIGWLAGQATDEQWEQAVADAHRMAAPYAEDAGVTR